MSEKLLPLLPNYYLNYYPKISHNTISIIKVVKVVVKIYTHVKKGDHDLSIGGISPKNNYLNTPPSQTAHFRAKKGSNFRLLPGKMEVDLHADSAF